ncbi:MAG TPA: glycerol-3-phosphate dehydrogenase [Xanthobacteraceae bacterium]|nr:glycerol-3-phosphate dehydrogenase [Xanthobacteraceae bacterium]
MTGEQAGHAEYDLAIVGGGINGCGIARDAAGRGLKVLLVEQGDLASATSSASTKLIHGGLRYLEHYEFSLVRKSLAERERLMKLAPHLVRPMRFVLPCVKGDRPAWMLRAGFWFYDHLARSSLPKTRVLDLADDPAGVPLKSGFHLGFEYSDCTTDDARLVIANAIGAREKGANIRTHTRLTAARREGDHWRLILQSGGVRQTASARVLVNAAGPWAARLNEIMLHLPADHAIRLVKGSHIVVPRLHAHERAYFFQNDDGRLVFAIPYQDSFTLIGTTEVDVGDEPEMPFASAEEIMYLCAVASRYFRTPVEPSKVVWHFAGIRPLVDDGAGNASDVTRDFTIALDGKSGEPPLLTVLGGKLTTYRRLAEAALEKLGKYFAMQPAWTANEPLPGGDLGERGVAGLIADIRERHTYIDEPLARRLAFSYGTRAWKMISETKSEADLGPRLAGNLHRIELDYLRSEEWAKTADDILWRRTKLGLVTTPAELAALKKALESPIALAS